MKIRELEVDGLNGWEERIHLTFNDDINIITGRNGSGKTTILKLIWFCVSSNIERAVREINFTKVKVSTSLYTLTVKREFRNDKEFCIYCIVSPSGEILIDKTEAVNGIDAVEEANMLTLGIFDTSIFFPTFRRIEGGFSMTDSKRHHSRKMIRRGEEIFVGNSQGFGDEIQEALSSHADRLSVGNHKFVSSISTVDIKQLVTKKHNDATNKVDNYSKSLSEKIFSEIRDYRQSSDSNEDALRDAVSTLDKINQDVTEFEQVREDAFKSLSVLSEMIVTIFRHKGIRLNPRVTLGAIDDSINSDSLSAGEKQMLSFLCYNALYSDCPFFIDEPELSLHVDWQRILLDVLIEQKTMNQLFVATHSPFIYTQYEDKEIMIGEDRGNSFE